jgi:hypothetical protein
MCFVSLVTMHYESSIPEPTVFRSQETDTNELSRKIKDFWEALGAARRLDVLMDQPDCEAPEKALLEDRVRRIEQMLNLD